MTQLFIRFYLGVLAVLFLAWFIYGYVIDARARADRARVVTQAHHGGMKLMVERLQESSPEDRLEAIRILQKSFRCPVELRPKSELSPSERRAITDLRTSIYLKLGDSGEGVGIGFDEATYLRMGPFSDYGLNAVEDSVQGWVRLASQRVNTATDPAQAISAIAKEFPYAVARQEAAKLPKFASDRFRAGREVVFYPLEENRWYASTQLANSGEYLQFGPFPAFVKVEQPAATTTLALVLLPAALAIAMLLRPVAKQLRQLETAAQAIAGGDLGARVDEKQLGSAQPLAAAFNHMAARTETMLRTQRELLQAVSHELKTPLARLRFAMGLVESAGTESQREERLQSMDDAVEDLNKLVEELVGYVRTESLELTPNKESIDALEAIQSAIGRAKEISPGIAFCVERATVEEDLTIHADRNAFQRAIGNLLSNAGRYARQRVVVRVGLNADRNGKKEESHSVLVEVEDDGPGIPLEDRKRVFEPFVRLKTESDEAKDRFRGAGVGLGLALVHRILEQHGGMVEVGDGSNGGCVVRTYWEPGH